MNHLNVTMSQIVCRKTYTTERASRANHKAVVVGSRGCCGAVTRVLWTIHYILLLNDGSSRSDLLWLDPEGPASGTTLRI